VALSRAVARAGAQTDVRRTARAAARLGLTGGGAAVAGDLVAVVALLAETGLDDAVAAARRRDRLVSADVGGGAKRARRARDVRRDGGERLAGIDRGRARTEAIVARRIVDEERRRRRNERARLVSRTLPGRPALARRLVVGRDEERSRDDVVVAV